MVPASRQGSGDSDDVQMAYIDLHDETKVSSLLTHSPTHALTHSLTYFIVAWQVMVYPNTCIFSLYNEDSHTNNPYIIPLGTTHSLTHSLIIQLVTLRAKCSSELTQWVTAIEQRQRTPKDNDIFTMYELNIATNEKMVCESDTDRLLTHSFTHALTHSLTHSLTPLHTHSLI